MTESVSKSASISPSSILSIIGGALMVAGGILALSMFGIWTSAGMPGGGVGGMMGGGGGGGSGGWGMMMSGGFMWSAVGIVTTISIGAGIVSIIGGYSIYKKPQGSGPWGIAILIAGIVGLIGMSGFFIGPILAIIGGILALTKR